MSHPAPEPLKNPFAPAQGMSCPASGLQTGPVPINRRFTNCCVLHKGRPWGAAYRDISALFAGHLDQVRHATRMLQDASDGDRNEIHQGNPIHRGRRPRGPKSRGALRQDRNIGRGRGHALSKRCKAPRTDFNRPPPRQEAAATAPRICSLMARKTERRKAPFCPPSSVRCRPSYTC